MTGGRSESSDNPVRSPHWRIGLSLAMPAPAVARGRGVARPAGAWRCGTASAAGCMAARRLVPLQGRNTGCGSMACDLPR